MKCIQCGTDNDSRERTANRGRCKKCNHPFAFEPTSMPQAFRFTDAFFAKVLKDISVDNTLFFTFKQLLYFIDKRLKRKSASSIGCMTLFMFVFLNFWLTNIVGSILYPLLGDVIFPFFSFIFNLSFAIVIYSKTNSKKLTYRERKGYGKILTIVGVLILVGGIIYSVAVLNSWIFFVLFTLLGMSSIYLSLRALRNQKPFPQSFLFSHSEISLWLNRWTAANGELQNKLPAPSQELPATPVNPELTVYSFDRVVICDSSVIAHFLVANNFHFENNSAVLSITGYPDGIFSTVLEMLKSNPNLIVYAIHDASPRGVSLVNRLRTSPNWFADRDITIYDLGILPRQVLEQPNCFICNSAESAQEAKRLPPEIKQQLTPKEIKWLEAGNFAELESFSPKKLLQIVTQGIALSRSPNADTTLVSLAEESDEQRGVFIYSVDSFG